MCVVINKNAPALARSLQQSSCRCKVFTKRETAYLIHGNSGAILTTFLTMKTCSKSILLLSSIAFHLGTVKLLSLILCLVFNSLTQKRSLHYRNDVRDGDLFGLIASQGFSPPWQGNHDSIFVATGVCGRGSLHHGGPGTRDQGPHYILQRPTCSIILLLLARLQPLKVPQPTQTAPPSEDLAFKAMSLWESVSHSRHYIGYIS